jgi:hypothetical protein
MDTTLGNLFRVMEHLVFQPEQSTGQLTRQPQGQAEHGNALLTDPKKSNALKMNTLCELLSRDGFELEWEVWTPAIFKMQRNQTKKSWLQPRAATKIGASWTCPAFKLIHAIRSPA